MRIKKVTFATSRLESMKRFYEDVMQFPLLAEERDSFRLGNELPYKILT